MPSTLVACPTVCLVATKGENQTADLVAAAFARRDVAVLWMKPDEVLRDLIDVNGLSLWDHKEAGSSQTLLASLTFAPHDDSPLHQVGALFSCAGDYAEHFDHARIVFERLGLAVMNSAAGTLVSGDKWLTHTLLEQAGVSQVPAVLANSVDAAQKTAVAFGLPVVLKMRHGYGGMGVRKAETLDEVARCFDELNGNSVPLIVERFIDCGGKDTRLCVLGGKVIGAFERRAGVGEFRSNLTLGGTGAPGRFGEAEEELGARVAKATGLQWFGLDVGHSVDSEQINSPFVFETNSIPTINGLLTYTGVDVSDTVVDHFIRINSNYFTGVAA